MSKVTITNPILTGKDGVDYINVSRVARTTLGRMLHGSYENTFTVPVHGEFLTLEGYMCWLRTGLKHDSYRKLEFLDVIRKHRSNKANIVHLPYFHLHVKLGMMSRLITDHDLSELLKGSDKLPLVAYRTDPSTGKYRQDNYLSMVIDMWDELRQKLLDSVDLESDIQDLLYITMNK